MAAGLQEVVLRFEFYQNRLSGFGAVMGQNLPFPNDLAVFPLIWPNQQQRANFNSLRNHLTNFDEIRTSELPSEDQSPCIFQSDDVGGLAKYPACVVFLDTVYIVNNESKLDSRLEISGLGRGQSKQYTRKTAEVTTN